MAVTLYTFFSFVAFLLYLQAALHLYRMMPGTKANKLFVLALASLTIISLFIFARQLTNDIQHVYMFDRLAVSGWVSFPLLANLYVVTSSGWNTVNKKTMHLIHFVLIPIAVFLIIRYMIHPQSLKMFYMTESGIWYFSIYIRKTWTIVAVLYGLVNTVLGIHVVYQWMQRQKRSKYMKDKIKTRLILASVVLFAFITVTSVIIVPVTGSTKLPSIMHIAALPPMFTLFLSTVFLHPQAYYKEMVSNLFMKNVREFVFYLDHTGKIYSVNDYTLEKMGYLLFEMVNKEAGVFFRPAKIINQQIDDVGMNRPGRQVISLLNPKFDDPITVSLSVTKVYDDFGNMSGFIIIAYDYQETHAFYKENKARMRQEQRLIEINKKLEEELDAKQDKLLKATELDRHETAMQYLAEQKITDEIKNKKNILREIHHRIKNNIQMLISILNLEQGKKGSGELVKETFSRIADRVRDISGVHDYFYNSPDLTKINISHFFQRRSDYLRSRFPTIKNVAVNISVTNVMLTIDQAIPCGIIVHELIHNTLQHAFNEQIESSNNNKHIENPPNPYRTLYIEFSRKNEQYFLHIADNGCGIVLQDGKPRRTKTGLNLVELLVNEYLNGQIHYAAESGTKISIFFPTTASSINNE